MGNVTSPLQGVAIYVNTPIGRLKFYSTVMGGEIGPLTLSQRQIQPIIPNGMAVANCIAVLLQFSVTKAAKDFCFYCAWENSKAAGCGNSGEGLDAWEWEHDQHLVMVGTEDADWLSSRIPLAPYDPSAYPVSMEENAICIRLKELASGGFYSLHYVVAWNNLPEPKECSCWYAVDIPHQVIRDLLANPPVNRDAAR